MSNFKNLIVCPQNDIEGISGSVTGSVLLLDGPLFNNDDLDSDNLIGDYWKPFGYNICSGAIFWEWNSGGGARDVKWHGLSLIEGNAAAGAVEFRAISGFDAFGNTLGVMRPWDFNASLGASTGDLDATDYAIIKTIPQQYSAGSHTTIGAGTHTMEFEMTTKAAVDQRDSCLMAIWIQPDGWAGSDHQETISKVNCKVELLDGIGGSVVKTLVDNGISGENIRPGVYGFWFDLTNSDYAGIESGTVTTYVKITLGDSPITEIGGFAIYSLDSSRIDADSDSGEDCDTGWISMVPTQTALEDLFVEEVGALRRFDFHHPFVDENGDSDPWEVTASSNGLNVFMRVVDDPSTELATNASQWAWQNSVSPFTIQQAHAGGGLRTTRLNRSTSVELSSNDLIRKSLGGFAWRIQRRGQKTVKYEVQNLSASDARVLYGYLQRLQNSQPVACYCLPDTPDVTDPYSVYGYVVGRVGISIRSGTKSSVSFSVQSI